MRRIAISSFAFSMSVISGCDYLGEPSCRKVLRSYGIENDDLSRSKIGQVSDLKITNIFCKPRDGQDTECTVENAEIIQFHSGDYVFFGQYPDGGRFGPSMLSCSRKSLDF